MEKVQKSIKSKITSDEEFVMEADVPAHSSSSNEESDEEVEDGGRQDQKNVDAIIAEMDEQEAAGRQDKESDEDQRQMYELSLLSPAAMVAHIQRLEKELYELSQREARELNRSKHLRIFGHSRRRSNK
ncbi:uncharacterized protein LOC128254803 [Drosophila gunungcola]|uniref:Uncharacterized protein n=1 Tax=Drosophila gunungcola TaxID=103775 RepID=A0A9P9YL30_9MUSC|nr:uncharacterized protein LOC128254803 [Drosophila gunungcola]KAI8038519.1 hypothetical protein M5D96_008419 [Drosophila gunungcola]